MRVLSAKLWRNIYVDRCIAILMTICGLWLSYDALMSRRGFALVVILVNFTLHHGLLLIRRPPSRLSNSPLEWGVALLGAHWALLYGVFPVGDEAIAHPWIIKGISFFGALLFWWSRASLGRNFGILPAERQIVLGGAYRFVRHPIYASAMVTGFAFVLEHWSLVSFLLYVSGFALMWGKAVFEERLLREDESYQSYCRVVPSKFIPRFV